MLSITITFIDTFKNKTIVSFCPNRKKKELSVFNSNETKTFSQLALEHFKSSLILYEYTKLYKIHSSLLLLRNFKFHSLTVSFIVIASRSRCRVI